MHTFGLNDPQVMDEWNIEIIREFIGNLREQPIYGSPVLGSNQVWYHSLQSLVEQNRLHGKITILCPFGWVDEEGQQILLTGLNPSEQSFFEAYKIKLVAMAEFFSDQSDVWIEVWNEPYHWNNENGYNHQMWYDDMNNLVHALRINANFSNIILVPGNEQGQSEKAMQIHGSTLLEKWGNLVFDLHAYEKWLINQSESDVLDRIDNISNAGLPILFGEIGVTNSSGLMNPDPFIRAIKQRNISVLGWLWVQNSTYPNALGG